MTPPLKTERHVGHLSPEVIENWQYRTGTSKERLSPDGYQLDIAFMSRPGAEDIQLDLILDYRTNIDRYPEFQAYFRDHQPPFLAVWGRHDPAFVPAGAEAYKRDLPRGGPSARYRPFCLGNTCRRDRSVHSELPDQTCLSSIRLSSSGLAQVATEKRTSAKLHGEDRYGFYDLFQVFLFKQRSFSRLAPTGCQQSPQNSVRLFGWIRRCRSQIT